MSCRATLIGLVVAVAATTLQGAESRQHAESFARKIVIIQEHAVAPQRAGATRRTPVSEDEVNSWFTYRAQELIPQGVTAPRLTIIGNGKVIGMATVDLDAVAKRRSGGGSAALGLIGGKLPITVTGILHTQDGRGRFELQAADVSGLPVPKLLLQELVSYYSRTPDHPEGLRLDDSFGLPSGIQKIEVGERQAVVVQ